MRPVAVFAIVFAVAAAAAAAPCPDPGPLPHDLGTAIKSVRKTLAAGRPAEALSRLDRAVAKSGNTGHPYPALLRGQILLSLGRPGEAEAALTEAVNRDPCALAGWRNLAAARHARNRPGPAAEATERALRLTPDRDGTLRHQAAAFHLAAGKPGRAIPHLERLAQWERPRTEWLASLGDAYEQVGRVADAADAYARAVRAGGDAADRYRAGRAYLAAGKPGKAAEMLAPLSKAEKGRAEWFLALGNALERIGKPNRAAAAFGRAFHRSAAPGVGLRAARLLLEAGDREGAIPLLRDLAGRRNVSVAQFRSLSAAFAQAGLPAEAARIRARVAERSGKPADRYQAALLFLEGDEPDSALPLLQSLAQLERPETEWLTTLGATLENQGHAGKAAEVWERVFRRTSGPASAFRAAALYRKAGEADTALALLEALPPDVEIPNAWGTLRADLLAAHGRYADAARALEARADFAETPEIRHRAASLWKRAGHPEKAAALLRKLVDRPDAKPEWRAELARLWVQTGAADDAEALMAGSEAETDSPGAPEMIRVRAEILLETGRSAEALPLLRKLAEKPDAAPKWEIALAETLLETGEREAAASAAHAVESSAENPLSAVDIHRLAAFWLRVDRPTDALSVLAAGETAESHDFLRARALGKLARWEEMEAVLARLRIRRPDDPAVWKLCARMGIQRERYLEAAADLAVAHRLSPPSPADWRRLGDLYARAGVHRKAAEAYQRAFGDSPTAAELDLLATTWKQARDPEAARRVAESAAKMAPTRKRWARVGNLSLEIRDFTGARAAFLRAAEQGDPDGEMSYWAGYAAWRAGDFTAAKAALERALEAADSDGRMIAKAQRLLEMMAGVG